MKNGTLKRGRRLLALMMSLFLAVSGLVISSPTTAYAAVDTVTIGETQQSGTIVPYGNFYKNSLCETIYTSEQVGSAGTISEIAYQVMSASSLATTSVKIYMGHTQKSAFSGSDDWISASDLTLVYSGTPTLGTAAGWEAVTLDEEFAYNGSDNLVIAVSRESTTYTSSLTYAYTQTSSNNSLYRRSDSLSNYTDITDTTSGTTAMYYANIRLSIETCTHENSVLQGSTEATCTEAGYDTYYCSDCGRTYTVETAEALGHDYQYSVTKEATCTEAGTQTVTCSRCDYAEDEVIDALGHDWDWDSAVADGDYLTASCSRCDQTKTKNLGIDEWDGSSEIWENGSGTQADPYLIESAANLAYLAASTTAGTTYSGEYFQVEVDIDLAGLTWTPIGTNSSHFLGTFDGNYHTIQGLATTASSNYQGLFGYVGGTSASNTATIKNLIVQGTVTGDSYVGGVTGSAGYADFENVGNEADVGGSSSYYVGGIVGDCTGVTTFTGCYNKGDINGYYLAYGFQNGVGGLVGTNYTTNKITMTSCYNLGNVSGGQSVGGLIGLGYATANPVDNSYNGLEAMVTRGYYLGSIGGYLKTAYDTTTYYGADTCAQANGVGSTYQLGTHTLYSDYTTLLALLGSDFQSGDSINSEYGGAPALAWEEGEAEPTPAYLVTFLTDGTASVCVDGETVSYAAVESGGSVDFTIKTSAGYSVASVTVDGAELTSADGVYTLTGVTAETEVVIETATGALSLVDGYYQIADEADLVAFAVLVEAGETDAKAQLTADIVLTEEWTPIGTYAEPFAGELDGCGYTISGLYLNGAYTYAGLFGCIDGASVSNLIVKGYVRSTLATASAAAVAGMASGICTFNHVGSEAIVISNNTNVGYYATGGILGFAESESSVVFSSCYNKGTIAGKSGHTGGILGGTNSYYINTDNGTQAGVIMLNCYNLGDVSKPGSYGYSGGLAGSAYGASLTNCYNLGTVTGNGTDDNGELIGYGTEATAENCYTSGDTDLSALVLGSAYKEGIGTSAPALSWETAAYEAPVSLTGIEVTQAPDKISYKTTESFDPSGMVVTATYSDGSTVQVSDYTWSPTDTLSEDVTQVVISYNDYLTVVDDVTATVDISVGQQVYTVTFDCADGTYIYVGSGGTGYETITDESGKVTGVNVYDTYSLLFIVRAESGYSVDTVTFSPEDVVYTSSVNADSVSYTITSVTQDISVSVNAQEADTYFNGEGSGTAEDPYLIQSEDDLRELANRVNAGRTYYGVSFLLTEDIELTGEWTPIGTGAYYQTTGSFQGTFDGGNHTVSGLSITSNHTESYNGYGLFGKVNGAVIKNLAVDGAITNQASDDSGCKSYYGGIVGVSYGGLTLENCTSHVDVTNSYYWQSQETAPESYVGGLIGYSYGGTLTVVNSYSDGSLMNRNTSAYYYNTTKNYVGGLLGGFYNYGDTDSSISNSFTISEVTCSSTSWQGAVIGYNGNSYGSVSVSDCWYLAGDVSDANGATGLSAEAFAGLADTLNTNADATLFKTDATGYPIFVWETETSVDPVVEPDTSWYTGDAESYTISTEEELLGLAEIVNGGNSLENVTILLDADIEVTSEWTPIGSYGTGSKPFSGTLNGQNHTVTITQNRSTLQDYNGLFGYISKATVERLIVAGSVTGGNYTAGIAGRAYDSAIQYCGNQAEVNGYGYMGGIVGYASSTTVLACYNRGDLVNTATTDVYTGGIAGYLTHVSDQSAIQCCYNTGTVTANSATDNYCYTGGIAGMSWSTAIVGSYSVGAISGGAYTGGIVGSTNLYYQQGGLNYYLTGTAAAGAGTGDDSADYILSATEEELTTAGSTVLENLGLAYENPETGINGGYPALKWEQDPDYQFEYITELYDAGDLREFMNNVKTGHDYADETVYLMADIDLEGFYDGTGFENLWTAIGDANQTVFAGTFDGQGYTVSNMLILNDTSGSLGFFSALPSSAVVRNLTVDGLIESYGDSSESSCVGGIVGWNQGTVENCVSNVSICAACYYAVGGIVGDNAGVITDCVNYGEVNGSSSSDRVGGIAGRMEPAYDGSTYEAVTSPSITGCGNYGDVTGYQYVGGVVGAQFNEDDNLNMADISDCFNRGAVSGYEDVGYIAGKSSVSVINCYYQLGDDTDSILVGSVSGSIYERPVSEAYMDTEEFSALLGADNAETASEASASAILLASDDEDETLAYFDTQDVWTVNICEDDSGYWRLTVTRLPQAYTGNLEGVQAGSAYYDVSDAAEDSLVLDAYGNVKQASFYLDNYEAGTEVAVDASEHTVTVSVNGETITVNMEELVTDYIEENEVITYSSQKADEIVTYGIAAEYVTLAQLLDYLELDADGVEQISFQPVDWEGNSAYIRTVDPDEVSLNEAVLVYKGYQSTTYGEATADIADTMNAPRLVYTGNDTDAFDSVKWVNTISITYEGGETEELQITSHPADVTGTAGSTAVFEVEATGSGLTYQWQYLNAGASTWRDSGMSGADTASISVPVTEARNGQQYRCVVTDGDGNTVTSDTATLTVTDEAGFTITLQPSDYTGLAGSTATFTVEATGTGMTYQWQYMSVGGTTWHDSGMSGATTATLSVPVTEVRDGQQYRCIVTDENGNSVISEAAILSLPSAGSIEITAQPSDCAGAVGDTVTFAVEAAGNGLSYQWQYMSSGGTEWHDSGMTGATTATLSVPVTEARDGQQYRCVITDEDGSMAVSDVVTLSVH
ncbi:MAG: hypothetical protein LIO80_02990 [Lachnospiraceae bacterium]|nr:hypothetical protein [Lachnospiraceae bacterium]